MIRALFRLVGCCSAALLFAAAAHDVRAESEQSQAALSHLEEQVHEFTLSNGLRVIMYKRGQAPVFGGVVAARVGGTDETLGKTGISHMFEHMAFKGSSTVGSKDFKKEKPLLEELEKLVQAMPAGGMLTPDQQKRWDEINKELGTLWSTEQFTREYEKRGASGMNATTDTEITRYFESLPRDSFEFWCQMESARLLDPVMRQFYQERNVVMEERRMRTDDSPQGMLYEQLLGMAFTAHPYRFPVIGYSADIKKLTATDLDAFRHVYYIPSNLVVALVGDVDEARDRPMIEHYFGALKAGPAPTRPTVVEPPQLGERRFVLEYPSSPLIYIAYHKPVYPNPDDAAISAMYEILAGNSISPLYTELVKKQKIAASVSAEEAPGEAYPNLLIFSMEPKAPHTNAEVIAAFDKVVDKFIHDGVTAEQLQIAKRAMTVDYISKMKSNLSLAIDLASTELIHGSWRVIFDWFRQVQNVTPEEVQKSAAKYLVTKNRTIGELKSVSKQSALKE